MYKLFINFIEDNRKEKKCIKKYEKNYGIIKSDIKKNIFWEDYMSKFKMPNQIMDLIALPVCTDENLDLSLLIILVVSSYSLENSFIYENLQIKLRVEGDAEKEHRTFDLDELTLEQAKALFCVHIEEQLTFANMMAKSDLNKKAIFEMRSDRIKRFNMLMANMLNYVGDGKDEFNIEDVLISDKESFENKDKEE